MSIAWLVRVARNKLVDHWRRQAREERKLAPGRTTRCRTDDPWDERLDVHRAHEVLAQLGPHHQAALTLRYLDGLSVPEVAERLGRTVHATEALLVRARTAFRRAYDEGVTMADPLEALRQPATPIAPDPAFRPPELRRALGPNPGASAATPPSRTHDRRRLGPDARLRPPGYRTLTPYICVHDGRAALDWYTEVLGATVRGEVSSWTTAGSGTPSWPSARPLMLADEFPEMGLVSPRSQEGSSSSLSLYVPDVDATYAHALDRGATGERPPED